MEDLDEDDASRARLRDREDNEDDDVDESDDVVDDETLDEERDPRRCFLLVRPRSDFRFFSLGLCFLRTTAPLSAVMAELVGNDGDVFESPPRLRALRPCTDGDATAAREAAGVASRAGG